MDKQMRVVRRTVLCGANAHQHNTVQLKIISPRFVTRPYTVLSLAPTVGVTDTSVTVQY